MNPLCVAFCEATQLSADSESQKDKSWTPTPEKKPGRIDSNYFKSAEWSVLGQEIEYPGRPWTDNDHRTPDGTTVITDSADNHIRTFVLLVSHNITC